MKPIKSNTAIRTQWIKPGIASPRQQIIRHLKWHCMNLCDVFPHDRHLGEERRDFCPALRGISLIVNASGVYTIKTPRGHGWGTCHWPTTVQQILSFVAEWSQVRRTWVYSVNLAFMQDCKAFFTSFICRFFPFAGLILAKQKGLWGRATHNTE